MPGFRTWMMFVVVGFLVTRSEGATIPSSMSGGIYSVECYMRRDGGAWDDGTATAQIKLVEVELQFVGRGDASCTHLAARKLCTNAQNCYKKNKWKALTIKPSGTTATVSSTGSAAVSITGIGCSPSSLSQGDQFWVQETGATGTYQLTLTHNDYGSCPDSDGDTVFKFNFDISKTNDNGSVFPAVGGEATRNDTEGWVNAPKKTTPVANDSAGYVEWSYDMKVVTQPSGSYSDKVDAKASVTFESDGLMRIYCYPRPWPTYEVFGIAVNWGIVTVSIPASGWGSDYGDSLAGADLETKIATLPRVQLGDVEHNGEEVICWLGMPRVKVWDNNPGDGVNLSVNRSDNERTYTVGSTTFEVIFKVGVGSDISLCIAPAGTWVEENKQTIDSVTAVEDDGVFEIVP